MGVDREYRIRISTVAEPAGIDATTSGLQGLSNAQDQAGESAERHGGHLREMHRLFHGLNEVLPGLGTLLQAAFSPVGAAISALVLGFGFLREKIKESNEEFKRFEEEASRPALHTTEALRQATVDYATGLEKLRERLADAARGERELKDIMRERHELIKAESEEEVALLEAQDKAELQSLQQAHQDKLISTEDYERRRLQIEQEAAERRRQLKLNEEMLEILAQRRLVEQAEMQQEGLNIAAGEAEAKKQGALAKLHSGRTLEETAKAKDEADKALKETEGSFTADTLQLLQTAGPGMSVDQFEAWARQRQSSEEGPLTPVLGRRYSRWSQLKLAAQSADIEFRRQPSDQAQRARDAGRATAAADLAAKRMEENQAFITKGGQEMDQHRGIYDIHADTNRRVSEAEHAAAKAMESSADAHVRVMQAMVAYATQHGHRDRRLEQELKRLQAQTRNAHAEGT